MRFTKLLGPVVFVLLSVYDASAKCAALVITIQGTITSNLGESDQHWQIRLNSLPDANWNNQAASSVGKEFTSIFYFDATKSGGHFSHKCSREPRQVDVVLMQNGVELERIKRKRLV